MRVRLNKYTAMLGLPAVAGIGLAWYISDNVEKTAVSKVKEIASVPIHTLSESDLDILEKANRYIASLGKVPVIPYVVKTEGEEKPTEPPPEHKLSFIYIGEGRRYAIINGTLLREGDFISKDEKVVKIRSRSVLVSGKWGKRWLKLIK